MKMRMRMGKSGFSLLELLIVLAIILLLTAVVVPMVDNYLAQAKIAKAQTDVEAFRSAFNLFRMDVGALPSCSGCNPATTGYFTGLVGVEGGSSAPVGSDGTLQGAIQSCMFPNNVVGWKGPYLTTQIMADPWNMWYQYEKDDCPQCAAHNFSMIWSVGPDRTNQAWPDSTMDGKPRGDDIIALMKGRL